jgi:HlyD family secretion protein
MPTSYGVSAIGRFEPMEPVTRVSAPYIQGHPATIAEVKVSEGDHVRAGQLIAVLAGRGQLKAAVEEAKARVEAEQIKLQDAQEAPLPSDMAAHAADVERCQAAVHFAQSEFDRYQSLRTTRDVSASETEDKRNQLINAQQMLEAAKARQAALSERHAQNVEAARSELDVARAQLDRARFDDASAEVHAPVDGVILHVRARPGEQVGPEGIVELARTAQMDVMAEVYETDVNRVRMGEHAEVTSNLLPAGTKLDGTVVDIGREVGRAAMTAGDSAAFADARVVLVRIRLADSNSASNLIDGKVSVVFRP